MVKKARVKKAQVTMFMLIGIVVLSIFGGLFYVTNSIAKAKLQERVNKMTSDLLQTTALQNYVELCLDKVTKDALGYVAKQGGNIYATQAGTKTYLGPLAVPYGIYILPFSGNNLSYGIWYHTNVFWRDNHYGYYKIPPGYLRDAQGSFFGEYTYPALCDTEGPNRVGFSSDLFRQCLTYSATGSIQEQMQDYVEKNLKTCVNFSTFASQLGYNITEGEVEANVTMGEDGLFVDVNYPLIFSFANYVPVTTSIVFQIDFRVRLKKMHELLSDLISQDLQNPSFDMLRDAEKSRHWQSGFEVMRFENVCPSCDTGKYDDVFVLTDKESNVAGENLRMIFAIKNRFPVLDWLNKYGQESAENRYDYYFLQDDKISIKPEAFDPDGNAVSYFYSGWAEDYDAFFKESCCQRAHGGCTTEPGMSNPAACVQVKTQDEIFDSVTMSEAARIQYADYFSDGVYHGPRNWTRSDEFLYTGKHGSYLTNENDIGPRNITVYVCDEEGLAHKEEVEKEPGFDNHTEDGKKEMFKLCDKQLVKMMIIDHPVVEINGKSAYDDIPAGKASIEDSFELDASTSVVFANVDKYLWQDFTETFYIETELEKFSVPYGYSAYDVSNISMDYFTKVGKHNFKVAVFHDIGMLELDEAEPLVEAEYSLDVYSCLPHRNDASFVYPFNHSFDAFMANHTCCLETEDGGYKLAGNTLSCMDYKTYGCLPDINVQTYPADLAVLETPVRLSNNVVAYKLEKYASQPYILEGGDANDIFLYQFKQKCGNRGNACSGDIADYWTKATACDNTNKGTGGNEWCSGPSFTKGTGAECKSGLIDANDDDIPECVNYGAGQTFQSVFLSGTGMCNNEWKQSVKGRYDGYGDTNGKYACLATCSSGEKAGMCVSTINSDCVCADNKAENTDKKDKNGNIVVGKAECDGIQDYKWDDIKCYYGCTSNCNLVGPAYTKCSKSDFDAGKDYCRFEETRVGSAVIDPDNVDYCYTNVKCDGLGVRADRGDYCPDAGTLSLLSKVRVSVDGNMMDVFEKNEITSDSAINLNELFCHTGIASCNEFAKCSIQRNSFIDHLRYSANIGGCDEFKIDAVSGKIYCYNENSNKCVHGIQGQGLCTASGWNLAADTCYPSGSQVSVSGMMKVVSGYSCGFDGCEYTYQ